MNLEIGQYIFFKDTEFLVCDIKIYNNEKYVLLYNEKADKVSIYNIIKDKSGWRFIRVKDENLFNKLIILFSDYEKYIKGDNDE